MTPSKTTGANLDYAFVENALFSHRSLIVKSQKNRIELVTRPDSGCALVMVMAFLQILVDLIEVS